MMDEVNFKVNLSYGNNEYLQDDGTKARQLMFIFWGIMIPIISGIGIIGNILTIIVLWRREMQSTTIYFLRTLVITDTGIIIGACIGLTTVAITRLNPNMWLYTDMINVWVTVAVSVERFIAICIPFYAVKICNKRNAFITLLIIVWVSIAFNIPRCFATTFHKCEEPITRECFTIVTTSFGKEYFFTKVYSVWMYLVLIYIVPLLALGVLNTLLVVELMKMRKRRIGTSIQDDNEANMALVLIIIVLVFIICQTPGLVAQFEFLEPDVFLNWLCISNTLFVLNSSVNFLIYTAVGRRFRKVLLRVFRVFVKSHVLSDVSKSSLIKNGNTINMNHLNDKGEPDDNSENNERCRLTATR
ncbi:hypothetical protein CHS0354_039391 [Potamilus streckersoni]|uniref:G-protein coupled receptors family 1 profile domain-containing protein n=1 Tax=Potamilus streckersoni TaxID=2493646 RepID=A0AAE0VNW2_9BIVA|nr:hypothetical protein CHS0354_039391 [Potamilus streckersoni]